MLIQQYQKEFVRPPNPSAQHLRCFAHIAGDIGEILPHLNAVLGGHQYITHPPSLTLKYRAKLITLYPQMIAINIVKDENEADDILKWLIQVINDTWERREDIEPRFDVLAKPRILDILRFLPKTNCGKCGFPTCMVFATQVCEGIKSLSDCPAIDEQNKKILMEYLMKFNLLKRQVRT
jgi:ArsR family metal-binding transcriptional regulator